MADERAPCPACDRLTLTAEGAGEVCGVCGWKDEAALRTDRDREGPGEVSLNAARANVVAFGLAFPPSEVGGS